MNNKLLLALLAATVLAGCAHQQVKSASDDSNFITATPTPSEESNPNWSNDGSIRAFAIPGDKIYCNGDQITATNDRDYIYVVNCKDKNDDIVIIPKKRVLDESTVAPQNIDN